MRPLLDNQIEAISRLGALKVGALFMEPGAGKTQTACMLVNSVTDIDRVLWVAPFQTIHAEKYSESVPAEVEKSGGLKFEVAYVGIESIQSSDRIYLDYRNWVESGRTFIVLDESIKIKNIDAKRSKRMLDIASLCEYRLVLNGTPMSRDLLDLWSQFEFVSPKILQMSYCQFKNTFCEWVKVTKRTGGRVKVNEYIKDYHNIDYLYSLISPYVYECSLKLDIGKSEHRVDYKIDRELKDEYFRLKDKYLDNEVLAAMNNNIFIEMTQKMQHTYCCSSAKVDAVRSILEKHDRSKVLIVCKFITSQEMVRNNFPDIDVLSYGKHIFGLNKQSHNVTIFWDKIFDYMARYQVQRRTYRTGQTEDCIYYDLTGDVGLEGMIDKNIHKKQRLLQYFKEVGAQQIAREL